MSRELRAAIASLLALMTLCGVAFGRQAGEPSGGEPQMPAPPRRPRQVEIVRIDMAPRGVFTSERWNTITVWITSRERAWQGVISVEFTQDGSQDCHAMVAAATTPGRVVPVEVLIAPPSSLTSIVVKALDSRERDRREFSGRPGTGVRAPTADPNAASVLILGEMNPDILIPRALMIRPTDPQSMSDQSGKKRAIWDITMTTSAPAQRAPQSWMGYDEHECVVLKAGTLRELSERQLQALRAWLWEGGRIALLADGGIDWRRLLPEGAGEDPIVMSDQVRVRAAAALRTLVTGRSEVAEPVTFPARAIRLTPTGRKQGWDLRWLCETDPAEGGSEQPGALAIGPVGMGVLAVLGADPERMPPALNADRSRELWRNACEPLLSDRVLVGETGWWWGGGYSPGSGRGEAERAAMTAVADSMAEVRSVGRMAFFTILAAMGVLAVLVGPVDAIMLRRLRVPHLNWLTVLGWVTLASIAAIIAPMALRRAEDKVSRIRVVDTIVAPEGAVSWRTGVVGIFAGAPGQFDLDGFGEGAWVRGISTLGSYESARTMPALRVVQGFGPGATLREGKPEAAAMQQWTFRLLHDRQPGATDPSAMTARVRAEDQGKYAVTLIGVPGAARVRTAALLVGMNGVVQRLEVKGLEAETGATRRGRAEQYVSTGSAQTEQEPAEKVVYDSEEDVPPLMSWDAPIARGQEPWAGIQTGAAIMPGAALGLPGASFRSNAIGMRVRSGTYVCVLVWLGDAPADVKGEREGVLQKTESVHRILVEVEE